ncbi:MAG TPA: MBL fold metallo-hydrolase [Chloroflexota bacterium]|nr:MBL fold metallo-hydrolase [Chloroflexota bacterium]
MYLRQFFLPGLGHGSYLVGDESAGVGAVIDPRRDFDCYLSAAQEVGLSIAHVLETHTHNDYVSGARELAAVTGAQVWASGARGGAGLECAFSPLYDGAEVMVGDITLRAWETPGHTPEHLAFVALEGDAGDAGDAGGAGGAGDTGDDAAPVAVFSGGSLMVGAAGRTDLTGERQTATLTRAQCDSIRRLLTLPDGTLVYPAHGGGSFCGGGGGASRWSTVGHERRTNPLARAADRNDPDGFACELLDALPVIPAYWSRMRPLNRRGPTPLAHLGAAGHGGILPPLALSPERVRELLDQDAVCVDTRDPAAYGGAHIPRSFSVGLGDSFGIWVGSVVPEDRPLVLVLPQAEGGAPDALAQAWSQAVRQLLRAGYDRVAGYLEGGLRAWSVAGLPFDHLPQLDARDAHAHAQNGAWRILDVRQPREWFGGHARGALHVPGADLPRRLDELEKDTRWLVVCSTGYRSAIAASLLRRAGHRHVANVLGGMSAWQAAHLPTER